MRTEEAPVWVPHGPNCICRPCRLARARVERLANRPRPTRSDEAAEKIAGLRAMGYTLAEIAEAAELSVGVVHKASRPGAFLRAATAERILELEVVSQPGGERRRRVRYSTERALTGLAGELGR